jgi:hypothetical protein
MLLGLVLPCLAGLAAPMVPAAMAGPFVQQGEKLIASGELGEGGFGQSVALSADGNTALVGAPYDEGGVGTAWVLTRSGSTWTQPGLKLMGAGEVGPGHFGSGVALSADGNTAAIVGGGVWVFTRTDGTWTQLGERLAIEGSSVALSPDGHTMLVGSRSASDGAGAAWVLIRSGSSWIQQGSKLEGGSEVGAGAFGTSVALSSDADTAIIGGPSDDGRLGAAWVFARSGMTWAQQGEKLTPDAAEDEEAGEASVPAFGASVALSADGDTALIGAPNLEGWEGFPNGAAWVYTRARETWAQQGARLEGGGESASGTGVALSANGDTALIGGPWAVGVGAFSGVASVFTRSHTTWTWRQQLVGRDELFDSEFGTSVALSSSAGTALIGGPTGFREYEEGGAVWAFVNVSPTAVTGEASSVARTSATLNATVNPNGATISECAFEYSPTMEGPWSTEPCSSLPGSGEQPTTVTAPIAGLIAGTVYHFRVVASSSEGVGYGEEEMFKTLPNPPVVTDVSPDAGVEAGGTTVRITGGELSEASAVEFGGVKASSFEVDSANLISAVAPAEPAGTVHVTVSNAGGTSSASADDVFSYVMPGPAPTVTKLSIKKGPAAGGTFVTITGTSFMGTTAVKFGAANAAGYEVRSATSIVALSPAATTGTVELHVETPNGESGITSKDHFGFEAPTVTSVSPESGPIVGNTPITVMGAGFAPGNGVTVFALGKGIAVGVVCPTTSECTLRSPAVAKAGVVDVRAKVSGKTGKKSPPGDSYTYD